MPVGPEILQRYDDVVTTVVALPQSAMLISQEWRPTVAGWTFVAAPRDGVSHSGFGTSVARTACDDSRASPERSSSDLCCVGCGAHTDSTC